MDMNEYVVGVLVRQKLAELRQEAWRYNLVAAMAPRRRPLRVTLGLGLIRLGRLVLGSAPHGALGVS